MGTNNFHNTRASKIYAVSERYEDEDGEMVNDEFVWENTRDNVHYALMAIDKDKTNYWQYVGDKDINLGETLRSFDATSIGEFYSDMSYAGVYFRVVLIPKTVAGYYEGFNLDFEISVLDDYGETDTDELECGVTKEEMNDVFSEYIYRDPYMAGMLSIHGDRLIEKLNDLISDGVKRLEEVFENFSDSLVKVAQFSNGEAIYEKAG